MESLSAFLIDSSVTSAGLIMDLSFPMCAKSNVNVPSIVMFIYTSFILNKYYADHLLGLIRWNIPLKFKRSWFLWYPDTPSDAK